MQKTILKTILGHNFGYILTDADGNQKIYNIYHHFQGSYNHNKNITYDKKGDILTYGNILSSLIEKPVYRQIT